MKYLTLGSVVPGRSRVIMEAWALTEAGYVPLEESEFHFEFQGVEEALAEYVGREAGYAPGAVGHLRFSVQGVDESDRTVLGMWVRGRGLDKLVSGD